MSGIEADVLTVRLTVKSVTRFDSVSLPAPLLWVIYGRFVNTFLAKYKVFLDILIIILAKIMILFTFGQNKKRSFLQLHYLSDLLQLLFCGVSLLCQNFFLGFVDFHC